MATTKILSPREQVVLHLAVWGHTNKQIAALLGVSAKTIEAHKANGMRKLNVSARFELVRYAVEVGWLRPDALPSCAAARALTEPLQATTPNEGRTPGFYPLPDRPESSTS